jgi:outer membrane protein OmpA-like peptidoglycan-associated protein
VRLHPFTQVAGPWMDANAGYVRTGADDCLGFDAHIGWDWRVDQGRLDVGPFVGFLQVVGPSDSLRPDDAHVVSIGIHVGLGAERPQTFLAKAATPPRPPPAAIPPPPPPDRDGDGIVDASDACPDVPGVHTDDPKTDGCPPAAVRLVDDHIEYDEVILFDTDSPQVRHESWPIVRKLATFIDSKPEIGRVDIAGHADERGSDAYNLALSKARAESVQELLIRFGVDPARLTSDAYGKSKPRAAGHTEADWAQNRRVEFVITRLARSTQVEATPLGVEEKQR